MAGPVTDALGVLVVVGLAAGAGLRSRGHADAGRAVLAGSWLLFAAFWAVLVEHFLFVKGSPIEGLLSLAAVPASAYVGLLVYRGRESLETLSRGVAVMGLVYLPFQLWPALSRPAIAMVVDQVSLVLGLLGYEYELVTGPEVGEGLGLRNGFLFVTGGQRYLTEVVLACTGIGSMAIFAGLVAAVEAPRRRKLKALAVVLPVIYVLNVARVTFIALAHGLQWFRYESLVGPVAWLMGLSRGDAMARVSWFVADRVVAQSLSVVALVALALFAVRVLPELVGIFEEVLFVATGREYDLAGALGSGPATDGGDPPAGQDE